MRGREGLQVRDLTYNFFSSQKIAIPLALLALLKEVKPSPDRKIKKTLLTVDNLFPPQQHSR